MGGWFVYGVFENMFTVVNILEIFFLYNIKFTTLNRLALYSIVSITSFQHPPSVIFQGSGVARQIKPLPFHI